MIYLLRGIAGILYEKVSLYTLQGTKVVYNNL